MSDQASCIQLDTSSAKTGLPLEIFAPRTETAMLCSLSWVPLSPGWMSEIDLAPAHKPKTIIQEQFPDSGLVASGPQSTIPPPKPRLG